jgi:MoaA/NifB/PqqE/SkfB family radical SAM enzyme
MFKVKEFPKDATPEVVHLEISDTCNMACPYCYVKDKVGKELTTAQWKVIIWELDKNGIFQVTFGGGEPTMREDLYELARYTKDLGLTLCMTSNGINIPNIANMILNQFDQINISWHGKLDVVDKALAKLEKAGVRRGINYCFSKEYTPDLLAVIGLAKKYDAEILFLTYKAISKDWKNQIMPKDVLAVAKDVEKLGVKVAVDGATCNTCLAAKRFCDIDSLGNVMVCSFIRKSIGNIVNKPFADIWASRKKVTCCPYVKTK